MNINNEYKINRYSLTNQVYDIIKSEILNGKILSGEEISVDGIARKLETSKTPVRESLNKLIGEGLVVNNGKSKMKIIELTLEEISNIFDLRQVLEVLALKESFLKISRTKLSENLIMLKESKKDLEKDDPKKSREADDMLHELIINSASNKWLLQIITQLKSLIDIVRNSYPSLSRYKASVDEDISIVEAIISEDKEKSIKNLNIHLEGIKNRAIFAFNTFKNKNAVINSKEGR